MQWAAVDDCGEKINHKRTYLDFFGPYDFGQVRKQVID